MNIKIVTTTQLIFNKFLSNNIKFNFRKHYNELKKMFELIIFIFIFRKNQ